MAFAQLPGLWFTSFRTRPFEGGGRILASISMKMWDFEVNIRTLNYASDIFEHLLHIRNCFLEETQ